MSIINRKLKIASLHKETCLWNVFRLCKLYKYNAIKHHEVYSPAMYCDIFTSANIKCCKWFATMDLHCTHRNKSFGQETPLNGIMTLMKLQVTGASGSEFWMCLCALLSQTPHPNTGLLVVLFGSQPSWPCKFQPCAICFLALKLIIVRWELEWKTAIASTRNIFASLGRGFRAGGVWWCWVILCPYNPYIYRVLWNRPTHHKSVQLALLQALSWGSSHHLGPQ